MEKQILHCDLKGYYYLFIFYIYIELNTVSNVPLSIEE